MRIALGIALALVAIVIARTLLISSSGDRLVSGQLEQIDEESAIAHLAGALKIPTVSIAPDQPGGGDALGSLIQHLEQSYPLVHATLRREQIGDYSLLYTWRGTDAALPGVLFIAHTDVVPVEPESETLWTHGPYSGDVAEGFIWGRSAIDMKSPVIGLLEALEHLLHQGMQPSRTIFLALGHDEEVGGRNGAAAVAARLSSRGVRLEYTLDEGSYVVEGVVPGVSRPVALIGIAEKGYLTLRLSAKASGGHSAMPSRSEAITRIARAIERLENHHMPASLGGAVSPMLEALAPEMPFAQRAVFANQWLFGALLLRLGFLKARPPPMP